MVKILGMDFDPTPGFNLVAPSRWGKNGAGPLETTTQHRNHNSELAVTRNTGTYVINGVIYDSAGRPVGTVPTPGPEDLSPAPVPLDVATARATAQEAARMNKVRGLRDEILGKRGNVMSAYDALFGDLDNLVRSKAGDIEKATGENIGKLTEQYTASIPKIRGSYDALGAGDSTDTRDANIGAKKGYDDSVAEVGKQKQSDLAKVGQYEAETKAGWNADKDSIMRLLNRVNETEDEGDLREARNQIEDKVGEAGASRAKLSTDEGARGRLSAITADAGRFDAIKSSLDNIVNSNLGGDVKSGAVQAVLNSADVSDEDKEKVKLQYGNVYGEQQAL